MKETGLKQAKILIPNTSDFTSWACIACDQFTSEVEYWKQLEEAVKGKKTALDLILPEVYLNDNMEERIKNINKNIHEYLSNGSFTELNEGFVLTVRSTPYVDRRIGLIGSIDLEKYEYSSKSEALIRSTEGTIEERIPPRLKIRKDAEAEFPHIMLLIDDEKQEIIESIYNNRENLQKIYDFELNMGGGHLTGYYVSDYKEVLEKFSSLLDSDRLINKYGANDQFAFAVGDGNHSLATAKAHWNVVKKGLTEQEKLTHPARYALCEIVNIYDNGIYFEPIHRYVSGVDRAKFLEGLKAVNGGKISVYDGQTDGDNAVIKDFSKENSLPDGIKQVDGYIKEYIEKFGGEVDYVHGDKNLKNLVDANANSVGIMFEKLDKAELFRYVSQKGSLPRKTFSMGEGVEKRYYLEGKKI